MPHLHFQPVGGAAGDMTLSALISAGVPVEGISGALEGLRLGHELRVRDTEVSGILATQLYVEAPHEHAHRTFADIKEMIEGADLPERAARRALAAFGRLAEAEGRVHGKSPEEVSFHEVGAVDSIVDIVGSCVALEQLGVETVSCGVLPLGTGTVEAAHGPLPLPAPATLEVLRGCHVRWSEEPHERTTPTGAALMHAFTGGSFTDAAPPMVVEGIGYGAGHASFESAPNVLRAVVGELEGASEGVELVETNIDDAGGELLGFATERLLEEGALDAWLEPIYMKRGRGAYKLCALVESAHRERLSHLIMYQTGALGVRHHPVGRTTAARRAVEVKLPYGVCQVKVGELEGEAFSVSPEASDTLRLATETGLPPAAVYEQARAAFREQYDADS